MDQGQEVWHPLSIGEAAEAPGTNLERGLTAAEAAARQKRFGPNELIEREDPSFRQLLLDQFRQFLVIILIVAALISFVLGEWLDGGAILTIVILRAGLWQKDLAKPIPACRRSPSTRRAGG